ncbi:MAG: hypothetical protein IIC59_10180 [Proteobacteria bacterium]|nr:hypothetical protein [Pseudomonadota bacterium]MCH8175536.1 hypothetical protein [Pseudomonadota bacterium]
MRPPVVACVLTLTVVAVVSAHAQERRIASPAGYSATEVGGSFDVRTGYAGGKLMLIWDQFQATIPFRIAE